MGPHDQPKDSGDKGEEGRPIFVPKTTCRDKEGESKPAYSI